MSDPVTEGAKHALSPELIHDLRTPLGQIIGYAELLVEKAEDAGDESLVPELRKVSAAGYRMLALVEDHFAPREAGEADARA
ncbi:MAG TPA: histidine kinase dimerization/phospho-acceptor domain-containing protein, partial [Longimicrobium sp.]|nr:histidine kinase dimerization/phospho-acceptor domain-containing protein [Longimicrobium sp.]